MSKERLEELRRWRSNLTENLVLADLSENLKATTRKYRDLLGYAIVQIERVQELEYDLKMANHALKITDNHGLENYILKRQNKQYREAIETVLDGGSLLESESETLRKALDESQ